MCSRAVKREINFFYDNLYAFNIWYQILFVLAFIMHNNFSLETYVIESTEQIVDAVEPGQ